jgi:hypothetical protein
LVFFFKEISSLKDWISNWRSLKDCLFSQQLMPKRKT